MPYLRKKEDWPRIRIGSAGVELTQVWHLEFDAQADTVLSVYDTPNLLPAYRSDYPSRTDLYLDDAEVTWTGVHSGIGGQRFKATLTYRSKAPDFYANPLDRKVVIWGGAERTEEVFGDVDGTTRTHSAGEVFG
ncbi:MAG: hypothetical protein AAGD32_05375, partial [Planctomycetota bacterium]